MHLFFLFTEFSINLFCLFLAVVLKPKMNIGTGNPTSAFKSVIHESELSESSFHDSFYSPLVTKPLEETLKEKYPPQSLPNKLQDSSSDSDSFPAKFSRSCKKNLAVLCSSSDDEPSTPKFHKPKTGKKENYPTRMDFIPKTIPESESELEDVFVSLTINEAPNVKPKKFVKPRTKKKTQVPKVVVQPDSKSRRSFLASLSSDIPEECRHPDATPYLKNFRKHRDELTNRLFLLFNDQIFKKNFEPNFSITWNARLTRTAGYCRHFTNRENGTFESRIELSAKIVDTPCRLRDTLVHELCHAATWVIDNCRGGIQNKSL